MLTVAEFTSARERFEQARDVEVLDDLALSICSRSDLAYIESAAMSPDDDISCSGLVSLFYSAGWIGWSESLLRSVVANPSSPRATIGCPALASMIIRAGDVLAHDVLMHASAPPWEGDILRAQAKVRNEMSPEMLPALIAGDLFREGAYLRAQLNGTVAPTTSDDVLLWYLKRFAGVPIVDDVFRANMFGPYGELCIVALGGFAEQDLPCSVLDRVASAGPNAAIRVSNVAAITYRRSKVEEYLDLVSMLHPAIGKDRASELITWMLNAADRG